VLPLSGVAASKKFMKGSPMTASNLTTPPERLVVLRLSEMPLKATAEEPMMSMSDMWQSADTVRMVGSFRFEQGADFEFEQPMAEALYVASGHLVYTTKDGEDVVRDGDCVQIDAGTTIRLKALEVTTGFFVLVNPN
jgi:quercetin dioxygenase-like cupin family protein